MTTNYCYLAIHYENRVPTTWYRHIRQTFSLYLNHWTVVSCRDSHCRY